MSKTPFQPSGRPSSAPPQTLIVTGGCGFIGSCFVRQRLERGDQVIVLDALTYAGHRENLDGAADTPAVKQAGGKLELVIGNICDGAKVAGLLAKYQPDAVVNFAAESHVDRSITSPSDFIETNIHGVFVLLNASLEYYQTLGGQGAASTAKRERFRYLQVSTDEVYGSLGATGKFSETTPYAPNSPYSSSKASGDLLTRAWFHTYGLPTLTTNCSNNYGPRQFPEKLIPLMIQHALHGKPLPVYGDGGNVRDWIHVEDHSAGISLALEKGRPGQTYCFGGNAERNNLDVVKTICAELDEMKPRGDGKSHTAGISFVKDRLGHDRRYAIDDSLAQRELGFTRRYRSFEEGLRQTIQWYLENEAWCRAVTKGEHS